MSDPIRSISQNNFLLASKQEVSHDNTLSGNGTAESPLGVLLSALTTAGITDVQVVNSLPYPTIPGVLYLIPEA